MSVIVTNKDMPESCFYCRFFRVDNMCCFVTDNFVPRDIRVTRNKMSNCPMKSVEGLIREIREKGELDLKGTRANCKSIKLGMEYAIKIVKEYCEVSE